MFYSKNPGEGIFSCHSCISLVPVLQIHVGEYFWLTTGKTSRPKELHNASSFISNSARETVVVGGHLSLGTIILTEPGSGRVGSFVSRNNEGLFVSRNNGSNCRTRERVICL